MKQNPSTTIFRSFRMGSLWENPMLRGLLGLSPAVLICTSLKQGLILGAFTLCVFLPTALLTYFFFRKLPFRARIPVYVLCSALILSPPFPRRRAVVPLGHGGDRAFFPAYHRKLRAVPHARNAGGRQHRPASRAP